MKHFRTLGLCLMAALSLMAFVGATQASALWKEAGSTIASNLEGNAKIVGLEPEKPISEGGTAGAVHGVLEVPAKEIEVLCTTANAKEGKLISGTVEVTGTLEFTECKTFQKKVEQKNCKPAEPIKASAKGTLFLHEKLLYGLIAPASGTLFTIIDYPENCALPDAEVSGSVVAECLGEKYELMKNNPTKEYCEEELVNHLITEAPRALFPSDVLKYGANPAFIKGVLSVALNTGSKWSGTV